VEKRRDTERAQSETEGLFAELGRVRAGPLRRGFRPPVDVYRTESPATVTVLCDVSGVDPAGLRLALADGILTIAGIRRRPAAVQARYQRVEIDYGPFERHIAVGDDIAVEGAEATYDRGLLTVRLPVEEREPSPPATLYIAVVRTA